MSSDVDGETVGLAGHFMHSFTQDWMRVGRRLDSFLRRCQRDRQVEFTDHFGGFEADDVRTQDFAVRFAEQDFHKTVNLATAQASNAPLTRQKITTTLSTESRRRTFDWPVVETVSGWPECRPPRH